MVADCSYSVLSLAKRCSMLGAMSGVLSLSLVAIFKPKLLERNYFQQFCEYACYQIIKTAQRFELRKRPLRILFLRHGESEGNIDKTLFERKPDNDHTLTEKGRRQALHAGRKLRELVGDEEVYFQVSPYRRTRETLQGILESFVDTHGKPVKKEELFPLADEERAVPHLERNFSKLSEDGSFRSYTAGTEFLESDEEEIPLEKLRKRNGSMNYLRVRSESLQQLLQHSDAEGGEENFHVWPSGLRYKVREDARLREQEFGNYQNAAAMKKAFKDRRSFGHFWYRFEHGESGGDVFDRVSDWWASMFREMTRNRFRNYVIITHGLTMRCLSMYYFKWSVEEFSRVQNPDNCDIWMLERGPDFKYRLITPTKMINGCQMPTHMTKYDRTGSNSSLVLDPDQACDGCPQTAKSEPSSLVTSPVAAPADSDRQGTSMPSLLPVPARGNACPYPGIG